MSSSLAVSLLVFLSPALAHAANPTTVEVVERAGQNKVDLKILPVGASITYGLDSTDGNGYRLDLQNLLQNQGHNVSYVGSRHHGNMTDNAVSAWSGDVVTEVEAKVLNSNVLTDYLPNVILINLGTNDCNRPHQNVAGAPDQYATFLNNIKIADPDALVVVSNLIHNRDTTVNDCIVGLNRGLHDVAKSANGTGQKITYVDMYDAVPLQDINATDLTHPTDTGYQIMAQVWYDGIMGSMNRISAPDAKGKPAPGNGSDPHPDATSTVGSTASSTATATSTAKASSLATSVQAPLLFRGIAAFWGQIPIYGSMVGGRLLEVYRLEQRYSRREKRTTIYSGAQYVDGEYHYNTIPISSKTGPSSYGSGRTSKRMSVINVTEIFSPSKKQTR
ncbi:Hypothetical protein R9X50_00340700 [Acrodontium crateriforme]|uniref:SGNH hydrolase-type esterase domain-containing protein n=1 Tax=Acrodontium crateriforme TaxID=150365 RepID=A0AAQ3M3Y1_9PEZI|nr:Hypothetical protein R9X50_00340700 [Acrodontium crateriforme]